MPSNHQRLLGDVSESTRRAVTDLLDRLLAGTIDRDDFLTLAAAAVSAGNTRAAVVADVGVAAILSQIGELTGPLGVDLPEWVLDESRLRDAFRTALEDEETAPGRVGLVGRSEPVAAAALAMTAVLRARKTRWIRVTDADPCPLCSRWADGVPRSGDVPMNRHTGCTCIQQPVR